MICCLIDDTHENCKAIVYLNFVDVSYLDNSKRSKILYNKIYLHNTWDPHLAQSLGPVKKETISTNF